MNSELKKIKKHYGEKMMHLCRELFSTILEHDNYLFKILQDNFYDNKFLYDDLVNNSLIEDFKSFIYGKYDNVPVEQNTTNKSPSELLDEAGYTLYECKSEADIQKFKKYYAKGEELCTFKGGRLKNCYVFFAVKKDVDNIIRENFRDPKREDEYGTSVINIQFSKGFHNTLSIKNRYNHRVVNPDATFFNDLDNIIPGLNNSFKEKYKLNYTVYPYNSFDIPGYVKANDGKYYKYNYKINNVYYCLDNIIIDNYNVVDKYKDKEKYILVDYFIIDLMNKKIITYLIDDDYTKEFDNIRKIEITKRENKKDITILLNDNKKVVLTVNRYNQMIKIYDEHTLEIKEALLYMHYLKEIDFPNVITIEDNFMECNHNLEKISFPNVKKIGNNFIGNAEHIKMINFPLLEKVGNDFMIYTGKIKELYFPNIMYIGNRFMLCNTTVREIRMPKVKKIRCSFLFKNECIKSIYMPELQEVGGGFLANNKALEEIALPNLTSVGNDFIRTNETINIISFPKLLDINNNFLMNNLKINEIYLPNVIKVGNCFMTYNKNMKYVNMPCLKYVGDDFLLKNKNIEKLELLELYRCGDTFLTSNEKLNYIYFPKLTSIGNFFMYRNNGLQQLSLPNLKTSGEFFMYENKILKTLFTPNLEVIGSKFLFSNTDLQWFDANIRKYGYEILSNNDLYKDFFNNKKVKKLTKK